MKAMTEARIKWRTEHALVFPDRPDYDFELGEDGEVLAIHVEPRRIANRMVEESMIAANICAGRVLGKEVGYGIFNVHTGFDEESRRRHRAAQDRRGPVREGRDRQPLRLLRPATLDRQPGHPLAGRQDPPLPELCPDVRRTGCPLRPGSGCLRHLDLPHPQIRRHGQPSPAQGGHRRQDPG